MTTLLHETTPRTLEQLVAQLQRDPVPGARVEAWVFEGVARRRAAERHLAAGGINARVRSAYKPLVHTFLEDVDPSTLRRVAIRYPVHEQADRTRFLREAYPLAALLPGVETRVIPGEGDLIYHVDLERLDGGRETIPVFAPNRVRDDHLGLHTLAPTGWLRITDSGDGRPDVDQAIETEFETIFWRVIEAVRAHPWGSQEPYFAQLVIRAEIPYAEQPLRYGDECISTAEALHEDLYFSLLELFKRRAGLPVDNRTIRPGQIVPDVRHTDGAPRVHVAVEPFNGPEPVSPSLPLDTADRPLSLAQIAKDLSALSGRPITARSSQGRTVAGVVRMGSRPGIVITAGQHANETTGVVGALRAAKRLAAIPDATFAVIPVENPDGYVLHRRMCAVHPRHMHHAARYTALGDDLQARTQEPWDEKAARLEAQRITGAELHVSLHGYPAHEWTRPLTGYLPRGFGRWTIPAGFHLILRHHTAWEERAAAFLQQLTTRLAQVPGLVAFNRTQLEMCRFHGGEPEEVPVYHDVPCRVIADDRAPFPLTLITEFPDETISGELFVLAHTVQMHTVLAAEEIYTPLARAGSTDNGSAAIGTQWR